MLDGHDIKHTRLARELVDANHPELARFEIARCRMSDRASGRFLFVLCGGRELAFKVEAVASYPAEDEKPKRRRRRKAE